MRSCWYINEQWMERERPPQSTLLRPATACLNPVPAKVIIVEPTEGPSVRDCVTGHSSSYVSAYESRRFNQTNFGEGRTEHEFAIYHEVMGGWARFLPQPLRIEEHTPDGIQKHIVDFARQWRDGRWEIGNIKLDWRGFDGVSGRKQTRLGKLAASLLDCDYVSVTGTSYLPDSCTPDVFKKNLVKVQMDRSTTVDDRDTFLVSRALSSSREHTAGSLADLLAPVPRVGFAKVCALMVRRVLVIDLIAPLSRDSLVTAPLPVAANLPGLFDRLRTSSVPVAGDPATIDLAA